MSYTNGTAALKMPSNYVPITEEEMEYISGGASNDKYQKQQQEKMRNEWKRTSEAKKKELYRKGWLCVGTMIFAVSGFLPETIVMGSSAVLVCKITSTAGTIFGYASVGM